MKKNLFIAITIISALLTGCNAASSANWQPQIVSNDIKPYVERAIEIIDDYLAFDISAEDADKAFSELISRIEPLAITERDPNKHLTDITTAHCINSFKYDKLSELSDADIRQKRDVLAYQIGKEVSGQAYSIETFSGLFNENDNPEYLQDFCAPARTADLFSGESLVSISLTFDAINGIAPSDLLAHINSLTNILSQKHAGDARIFITYAYYEQPVFWLTLNINGNAITGRLTNNSYSGSEDGPSVTIESAEKIRDALAVGAQYLGDHKIP